MAQQKQPSRTDPRLSIFVRVGLTLTAVAILFVTGVNFLGAKYRLITYVPEINGVQSGAPVDLDGLNVGNVESLCPRGCSRCGGIDLKLPRLGVCIVAPQILNLLRSRKGQASEVRYVINVGQRFANRPSSRHFVRLRPSVPPERCEKSILITIISSDLSIVPFY